MAGCLFSQKCALLYSILKGQSHDFNIMFFHKPVYVVMDYLLCVKTISMIIQENINNMFNNEQRRKKYLKYFNYR
jgi:hypothetical protein